MYPGITLLHSLEHKLLISSVIIFLGMEILHSDARCRPVESGEEEILNAVKNIWRKFIVETDRFKIEALNYKNAQNQLVKDMRFALPTEYRGSIAVEEVADDPWKRPLLDIVLDELFLDLLKDFPDHPHLLSWKTDKLYWEEFVETKTRNNGGSARKNLPTAI